MAVSQQYVSAATPMGANLVDGGATFRVWAPGATAVYVVIGGVVPYTPDPDDALLNDPASGHWTGFVPGVVDGTKYRFWVVGPGGSGFKRDPWARELELYDYHNGDCIARNPDVYPWHDGHYRSPAFSDLVVYQLHIGVFSATDAAGRDRRPGRVAKFLDAVERIPYLADLGVTAIQPLPLVEFQGEWSLGYNGTDLFSPESDYAVGPEELPPYLDTVNALLAAKGCTPLTLSQLAGQINQLKAFVDLCHVYGLAVIVDVVYNHAGGGLDPQSIDWFDFPAQQDGGSNLYFTDRSWAGGRVFAFGKPEVQDFLIANARLFLEEYHADGLRFDEVSVIDWNGGWHFCQNMTATLRYVKPEAALIAEYWGAQRWLALLPAPHGMGFDLGYNDTVRDAVRSVLVEAAGGAHAAVWMGRLANALNRPWNAPFAWQAYNCIENHDFVLDMDGDHRKPRIPRLADSADPRSWYARSRSRVATGFLLTAPGVPMLFMGQEFLEDKLWSDSPRNTDALIWWAGLEGVDRHMADFHRFTRDLIWLRRRHPALRADPVSAYHVDEANRVLAFHRWVPGVGRDVVVVVSLREIPFDGWSYELGFPLEGRWHEVFNSDVYDRWVNPEARGNLGGISAYPKPLHGQGYAAGITLPANSILVFARDWGD